MVHSEKVGQLFYTQNKAQVRVQSCEVRLPEHPRVHRIGEDAPEYILVVSYQPSLTLHHDWFLHQTLAHWVTSV